MESPTAMAIPGSTPRTATPKKAAIDEGELGAAHLPEPPQPRDVGEREGGRHDHGGQGGLGQVAEQSGDDDEHQHDQSGPDQSGDLRLGTGLLGHGSAGSTGAHGKPLEQPGGDVRRADADHLLVGLHLVPAPAGECRSGRDGVGQCDEGDPERTGDEQSEVRHRTHRGS